MAKKDRPLPKPPATPFGKQQAESGEQGLMADRMAEAAALGKLDEYLERELPDNDQARSLARMMMGMTGMVPADAPMPLREKGSGSGERPGKEALSLPPEDVLKAIEGGDVQGLMGLLRREHQVRNPGADAGPAPAEAEAQAERPSGMPVIDKALIDEMIRIATDNSVTLDWIILRAIKVYVEEYRKTGKL